MKRAGNSFWPGQATQEERRHTRKNIILEDVGITSATLGLAVSRMAPVLSSVSTEADLDEAISDWIQEEFESGTPLHLVGDALSGLYHFEPFTRRKIPKAWRLCGIWRKPLPRTAHHSRHRLGHGGVVRSSSGADNGVAAPPGMPLPAADGRVVAVATH